MLLLKIVLYYDTIFLVKKVEQEYVIENIKSFEPKQVFECGQCFRWNEETDESYTGVFGTNVLNVRKEGNKLYIKGICNGNIKQVCTEYFDLNRDYEKIKNTLSKVDKNVIKENRFDFSRI